MDHFSEPLAGSLVLNIFEKIKLILLHWFAERSKLVHKDAINTVCFSQNLIQKLMSLLLFSRNKCKRLKIAKTD